MQGDLLEHAIIKRVTTATKDAIPHILLLLSEGNENTEVDQFTIQRRGAGDFRGIFKGWHRGTDGLPASFVWFVNAPTGEQLLAIAEAGFNIGNYGGIPDAYPRRRRDERSIRGVHSYD